MEPYGYIYLVQNSLNGKLYIGQTTTSVSDRWVKHLSHSREGGKKYPLYNAIRKHGADAFAVRVLTVAGDRTALDLKERILIRAYGAMSGSRGYNCRAGGRAGGRMSEETKSKIRDANTGKIRTPEMRERIGVVQRGRKQSAEVIAMRFANAKGRKMPPRTAEHTEKLRKVHLGRKQPEDEKLRRAAKNRGRKNTPETIEKMRQAALNRSSESRENMRKAALERVARNGGIAVRRF